MLKSLPFMLEVESQEPDELFADKVDLFKICYECDGCRVMGFAAFPKDIQGEIPAVIFNRGGNREFGILHPNAVCRLAARGYAALGSQYRGNAGGTGLEEFGGADVNDVIRLIDIALELPFAIKTTEGHHYRRALMQAARQPGATAPRHMVPTRDGKGVVFISHIGEIQPSGFLPITAGNVRTDDLATVYRTHPIFTRLRDDDALGGKCGRCEYRRVCGGSRARAYGTCGDMFGPEPLCNYIPAALRGSAQP